MGRLSLNMALILPYFKMDVIDWLQSEKIEQMSNACVGAYSILLCEAWTRPNCSLPCEPDRLMVLARWKGTSEEFAPLLKCFVPLKGDKSRVVNPRLKLEWDKACEMMQVLSESGQRGAQKRWEKKTPRPKADPKPAEDWLTTLKANPAYQHLNIDTELAKMDAWLSTKPGRKKTKSFVVNWLNKIDAPLTNGHSKTSPPPIPPKNDPIGRGQWKQTYGDPRQYGYE